MDLRRWTTTLTAASAMLFLGAEALLAQGIGRGPGPHDGPPPIPPGLHDRSPPPGQPFGGTPPGQGGTPPGLGSVALTAPANRAARVEAAALAEAARGLLSSPVRLPAVLEAHNALVRASSERFLSDPPELFLALHAVLAELSEAAAEAEAAREVYGSR